MTRDDADYIRSQLTARLEDVLASYFPGHVIRRGKAYLSAKGPKNLGSWSVNLTGGKRGAWYRFSQGIGGGVIELLSYQLYGRIDAYADAFREARAFLGISGEVDEKANQRARQRQEEARRKAEIEDARYHEDTLAAAERICREVKPITGTLAETYLHNFELPTPPMGWPECLRFHPALPYPGKCRMPALVARVDDVAGNITGVWREFISADGRKAAVENQKLGLGPVSGGAVRLGGQGGCIGVAEGVRTALAAWALIGFEYPVWACLSTSGLVGFEVPLFVERIVGFPDGDRPYRKQGNEFVPAIPAGRKAMLALKERVEQDGIGFTLAAEPPANLDYLDIWQNCTGEAA